MSEADGEYVTQIAQCNEGRETACSCAVTEDIAEEETCDDDFAFCKIGLWNRSKVGYIGEDV
jgi:hypothetical protein